MVASQPGDDYTVPSNDLNIAIAITASRASSDQPDTLTGYQIKPIYVVPSDGIDHQYDLNGTLNSILDEGNNFLENQIGYRYQVDRTTTGYDIQFFKSNYSTSYMQSAVDLNNDLFNELSLADNPSLNRKDYIFFVDINYLRGGMYCGYASIPGYVSVVVLGSGTSENGSCNSKSGQVANYASLTWIHESFHNLGVEHTSDDTCDLMRGSGNCASNWSIDRNRSRYVGSDKQGVNVLSLRVWQGYVNDQNLRASCILYNSRMTRQDGVRYALCPTGTQIIGALTYCWSSINSTELQVLQNGSWVSLGFGSHYNSPWGKYVSWSCSDSAYTAPWIQLTVNTPGFQTYRWLVNGKEAEQFKIYWQS